MEIRALVARARNHYVAQFEEFIERQSSGCSRGAAEVKLLLSDKTQLFRHMYCADFVKNDAGAAIVDLQPEHVLSFDMIAGTFGRAEARIERLRWDDVIVRHDLPALREEIFTGWFERWFDPDEKRYEPTLKLSGKIHSLLVETAAVNVDLGTAPTDAFWQLLEVLESAGASDIEVSAGSAK